MIASLVHGAIAGARMVVGGTVVGGEVVVVCAAIGRVTVELVVVFVNAELVVDECLPITTMAIIATAVTATMAASTIIVRLSLIED